MFEGYSLLPSAAVGTASVVFGAVLFMLSERTGTPQPSLNQLERKVQAVQTDLKWRGKVSDTELENVRLDLKNHLDKVQMQLDELTRQQMASPNLPGGD